MHNFSTLDEVKKMEAAAEEKRVAGIHQIMLMAESRGCAPKDLGKWAILVEVGEPVDSEGDDRWFCDSVHTLTLNSEPIIQWERQGEGFFDYKDPSEWVSTVYDGDEIPDCVVNFLAMIELDDKVPDVPKPHAVEDEYANDEAPDGKFAVWLHTTGNPVVRRYRTRKSAVVVATEFTRRAQKGYGIAMLGYEPRILTKDGNWAPLNKSRSRKKNAGEAV